jgi:hypothetical protein
MPSLALAIVSRSFEPRLLGTVTLVFVVFGVAGGLLAVGAVGLKF